MHSAERPPLALSEGYTMGSYAWEIDGNDVGVGDTFEDAGGSTMGISGSAANAYSAGEHMSGDCSWGSCYKGHLQGGMRQYFS